MLRQRLCGCIIDGVEFVGFNSINFTFNCIEQFLSDFECECWHDLCELEMISYKRH